MGEGRRVDGGERRVDGGEGRVDGDREGWLRVRRVEEREGWIRMDESGQSMVEGEGLVDAERNEGMGKGCGRREMRRG